MSRPTFPQLKEIMGTLPNCLKATTITNGYDTMGRANIKEGPFFGSGFEYNQTAPQNVPLSVTSFDYFGKPVQIESADGALAGGVTAGLIYTGVPNAIAAAGGGYASGFAQCGEKCAQQGALFAFAGSVITNAVKLSDMAGNQVEIPEKGTPERLAMQEKNDVYAITPDKGNLIGKILGLLGDSNNHVWHTKDVLNAPEGGRLATLIQRNVPWPGEEYWEPGQYNLLFNNCVTRFGYPGVWTPSQYNALYNYPGLGYYWRRLQ